MTHQTLPDRALELLAHAIEKLVHQHLRDATQHALAYARHGSAHLAVGVDADQRDLTIWRERDLGLTSDEAGSPTALDQQGVAGWLDLVRDADFAVVGTANRGDTHLQRRVVAVLADKVESFATRNAALERLSAQQQRPDPIRRGVEGVLAV